jgi:N-methylhydantoinase B/oxoprolinase/acetone carboxylase alpha subunit
VLNCDKPMAVNLRTRTGWYLAPNIFGALASAVPRRVQAATGLPVAVNIYGSDAAGIYSDHLFMGGGQGASAHGDGISGLLWPTSAANTSIELFEQRVPVIVEEKTYIPDSGGPGRHRGGLGQRVTLRKREADGLPTLASVYPEGVKIETSGLFGGGAGRAARGLVRDGAGAIVKDCGTGELVRLTTDQELVEVCLSGGSGFGDPRERPLDAVARDVADGFVTAQGAEQDYGVAIGADGTVDRAASTRRRQIGTAAE